MVCFEVIFTISHCVMYLIWCLIIGTKSGRSLLIDDGALPWIVQNANSEAPPIRRHIELALCHLAQHGTWTSLNSLILLNNLDFLYLFL
jgi:hypothetical protein